MIPRYRYEPPDEPEPDPETAEEIMTEEAYLERKWQQEREAEEC